MESGHDRVQLDAGKLTYPTMSRVRKLKSIKGRCEDDPLKPAYPVHCVQCEEHENISQNSGGSPRHQVFHLTDLQIR